ncbi:DUF2085 domain-containing protein [Lachnospiraceae bacterium]|nr:DUF2085 domain-containing protein [Lachnospiraceae bacterium]
MNGKDRIWIKTMDWCSKYWGCHQLPERSFFYYKYQFPVCARCTGIIIGYFFSLIYAIFFSQLSIYLEIILIIPMSIDGLLQFFTSYISNNFKRFATGLLAGFSFIQLIKSIMILLFK